MKLRNVIIMPAQPKEMMPSYWSLCDAALVHLKDTPLFETVIPSKIFEAMGMIRWLDLPPVIVLFYTSLIASFSVPIVLAAPRGQASEIVAGSGAGISVRPEAPRELLEAVRLLRNNPPLRLRMAEQSRAAAPSYSRERQARGMLLLMQDATGARTGIEAVA
jgi:glycosyltransferase involved in cell wall biosynthesis